MCRSIANSNLSRSGVCDTPHNASLRPPQRGGKLSPSPPFAALLKTFRFSKGSLLHGPAPPLCRPPVAPHPPAARYTLAASGAGPGHHRGDQGYGDGFHWTAAGQCHCVAPPSVDQCGTDADHQRERGICRDVASSGNLRCTGPGPGLSGGPAGQCGRSAGRNGRAELCPGAAGGPARGADRCRPRAAGGRDPIRIGHPAQQRRGGGPSQQRPKHLQLHHAHPERGDGSGSRRR
jgi:hypothetical protein